MKGRAQANMKKMFQAIEVINELIQGVFTIMGVVLYFLLE